MNEPVSETSYNWCRSLFYQFAASGVGHVAISPGSRSTPLAVAADSTEGLETSMHIDERSGSYFALGLAKATSKPVILICTSGTAAANYFPAVVEAFYSGVPLIVITADRPPELQNRGAPQTIDQIELYGKHVRSFFQSEVPSDSTQNEALLLASEAFKQSLKPSPGPVHINCPLREPLEPSNTPFPKVAAIEISDKEEKVNASDLERFIEYEKGLIVVGPLNADFSACGKIAELGNTTGWPIVADPASSMRNGSHTTNCLIVSTGEHLFRSSWVKDHKPDVIVQMGKMPTSKGYKLFLNDVGCENIVCVDNLGFFPDPENVVTHRIQASPSSLAEAITNFHSIKEQTNWNKDWEKAEKIASKVTKELIESSIFDEASVARYLGEELPDGSCLVVSNSMPIRDLDAFLPVTTKTLKIFSNRGANGIDGVISTAAGISKGSPGVPTVLFTGDLAFLHDLSGFTALKRIGVNLTIVVVDNNGGGIFSFLPIADAEAVDFQKLFHTPHGLDIETIGSTLGMKVFKPENLKDFSTAVNESVKMNETNLIHVATDAETNVSTHKLTTANVNEALR